MSKDRVLVAVLANPPVTSGARTRNSLVHALAPTECSVLIVANIYALPTRDVPDIGAQGRSPEGWDLARQELRNAISGADEVLAGWGMNRLSGAARDHRTRQLTWLRDLCESHSIHTAWTVGGQPRHPSRWPQYVSDRHSRTGPGSTAERLLEVVKPMPWADLLDVRTTSRSR
jgi:hypothetical protein